MADATGACPRDFDSLAAVTHALATVPYAWSVEVLLETDAGDARRRVPASMATLDETPHGVVLRAQAAHLDWMARFLVSLECPFLIRRPPELRAALRHLADEITAQATRVSSPGE